MNPRLQKLGSDWKTWVALLLGGSAGVSAFTGLGKTISGAVTAFRDLPPGTRWIVAGAFVVVAILFLVAALGHRSQLLQPQRFLLSPDDPQHLVGREEEIRHLARQCQRHALVFLVGDSGSGKTSLVRAGLTYGLRTGTDLANGVGDFVPLVVDLSGLTWESGLAVAIARELNKLPEAMLQALGAKDAPSDQDVFTWLRNRPVHTPSQLLIILDQFDDYLGAHRDHFYEGTTLRRPAEIEGNGDWKEVADLLRSDTIHVVVVARPEVGDSLPALFFVDEARIAHERLFSLEATLAAPLLDRLTEPVDGRLVVSEPEFGWLQLRSRLLRDLQRSGGGLVRPIQLAVALNCLRFLRHLTVAEYERADGLLGLERLHIERHAMKAADVADISVEDVLGALRTLVSSDGTKTSQIERTMFDCVLVNHGANPAAAASAVSRLESDMILRRVSGYDGRSETLLLYHDYLARGIREAHRQIDRWNALLSEKRQGFTEAMGWRQRWRALLSPAEQARLLWGFIRGRVSVGGKRGYFGFSLLRDLPVVLTVVLLGVVGWGAGEYRRREIVTEVMAAIGHREDVSEEETNQIRRLGTAGHRAVVHAFRLIEQNPETAERAYRRIDYLVRMATGLDPDGQDSRALVKHFVLPALDSIDDRVRLVACGVVLSGGLHLLRSDARELAQNLVRCMGKRRGSRFFALAGESLIALSVKLESKDALDLARSLVEPMRAERDGYPLAKVGVLFGGLSAKLDSKDALDLAQLLLEQMKHEENGYTLAKLGMALGTLSTKLDRKDILPGAQLLLGRMKAEKNGDTLARLGEALGALSAKMDNKDILPGSQLLLERMRAEENGFPPGHYLVTLGEALGALSAKMDGKDIMPVVQFLLERMKAESVFLRPLGKALGTLGANLEGKDIMPVVQFLLDGMKADKSDEAQMTFGEALRTLSAKLDSRDALALTQTLLESMKAEKYYSLDRNGLQWALAQRMPGAEMLIEEMAPLEEGSLPRGRLDRILRIAHAKLDSQDALAFAQILLESMKGEEDARVLWHWSEVLRAVSAKLDGKDALTLAQILLESMKAEKDTFVLWHWGEAFGALSAKLDSRDILPGAQLLLERMRVEKNGWTFAKLGEAFGALSARLDSGDILPGAQLLLERMKAENPGDSLAKLGEALGALSARLDTKDILPGAQLLLEQMRAKNSGDSLAKLGEALGALSAKLDSRDILLGAQLLLEQIVGQTGGSLEKEGRVLWALCSKLNGEETIAVQQRVLEKIPTRSNLESLNLLAETFAKCGSALRKTVSFPPYRHPVRIEQAYVDLLKKPLIVGKARTALVDALEKASGQVFDGDQWRFVDWATQTEAGRAMKLDLKGQPSWK